MKPDVASNAKQSLDFETLFRREYPPIVREIDLMLGDRNEAEQVAQEAFARAYVNWRKVQRFDKPGAWVRRVAIRIAIRWRRSRILPVSFIDQAPSEDVPTGLILDVRRAVLQLPRVQRAAIVLRYYRDLTVAEVAYSLACKEGTVKAHLNRARTRLAELLSDYRPSGEID